MTKKYTQIEDKKVMGSLYPNSITKSQKWGSLQAINMIK